MPRKEDERMYRDLAWTWPIISPPEDYAAEAGMFMQAISENSTFRPHTMLDLGCGGGHNDFHLKKQLKVTGVDLSEGMLRNARALNPEVEYVQGDMRTLRLGRQFDCVVMADSVMYMLTEKDLTAAFETAFLHLRPGGVFCTYIEELPGKFRDSTYTHQPRMSEGTEITLIEHKWDPDRTDTRFELLFIYIIMEGGEVRVETDRHTCGIFPLAVWKPALKEAGFRVGSVNAPLPDIHRLFVCNRPL